MNFFRYYGNYHGKDKQCLLPWIKRLDPAIKKMIIMRINFVILFFIITMMHVSAALRAQSITLSVKNTPLIEVFNQIKKQSGFQFLYNNADVGKTKSITLNIKGVSLKEALDQCLNDQPLTYEILDKTIVVKLKPTSLTDKIISFFKKLTITGKVIDEKGEPLSEVIVKIKGTNKTTVTNKQGNFSIDIEDNNAVLQFTFVGYQAQEYNVKENSNPTIILKEIVRELEEFSVVNTGYQSLPKERATGSFEKINNNLFNRSVSMNVLDRIKNLSSGIFYNNDANSTESLIVRGRSTIFSGTAPLIVIDNFPYDGDINNINPNDVESVTLLKDAAAASIWGARAGNGVIVITTKKGSTDKPQITLNNTVTIKQRPRISEMPIAGTSDYIELEKYLFIKGNYTAEENNDLFNNGHSPFTPVIELLRQARDGKITNEQANSSIEQFKSYNAQEEIQKYLYRNSLVRQHSLGISGNSSNINYYLSANWDKNLDNLIGKANDRISLRSQQSFRLSSRLQLDAGINYVRNNFNQGNNPGYMLTNGSTKGLYPYARLVDDEGNPVNLIQNYNTAFIQKAATAGLPDWTYNPINDINYTKTSNSVTDVIANTGLKVNITNGLELYLKYQYEHQLTRAMNDFSSQSFFTRNLINQYARVSDKGVVSYPIPKGGILDKNNDDLISHQGRAQLSYHTLIKEKHEISAIAGWEIKNYRTTRDAARLYGYDQNSSSINGVIDYKTQFQQYDNIYNSFNIPAQAGVYGTTNRYLSYFTNVSYTYNDRYIISGSARQDASNLFGVKTNQKSVPLWSAGAAWVLSKESFYNVSWLPELKLRATYGYQGNVYNNATAYATATFDIATNSGLPMATLKNPPNALLRWERSGTFNIGLDYGFAGRIISGSVEYYHKKSKDLMGYAPIDPTTGIAFNNTTTTFFGNVAAMKGQGIDLTINAELKKGAFGWNSSLLSSYNVSKVTSYDMPVSPIGKNYISISSFTPIPGKSVYSLFSYRWAGLNPLNGNPQGYLNGKVSEDYTSILAQTHLDSMIYNGPKEPKYFGAWRNTFSYRELSLSFNISYKFGYFYRKPSVNYGDLFNKWTGNSDFAMRWQKPGDETTTHVPSVVYPAAFDRDQFYNYSEVLVEKGDHIRLEDITISYTLRKQQHKILPVQEVKIYGYVSNLGLLWKASNAVKDPDYINYPNPGKSFAFGVNLIF